MKPEAVILIQDVWMNKYDGDPAVLERMENNGVRSEPDRKEALLMVVSEPGKLDLNVLIPYKRNGPVIQWEERREEQGQQFNRLLPEEWKSRPAISRIGEN